MQTDELTRHAESQGPDPETPGPEGVNSRYRRYWKAVLLLVLFFAAISVFFWGPELGDRSEPELQVNTPSMKNLPTTSTKQMSLEVTEQEGTEGKGTSE